MSDLTIVGYDVFCALKGWRRHPDLEGCIVEVSAGGYEFVIYEEDGDDLARYVATDPPEHEEGDTHIRDRIRAMRSGDE